MTGGGTGAEGKTRKERVLAEGSERDWESNRYQPGRGPHFSQVPLELLKDPEADSYILATYSAVYAVAFFSRNKEGPASDRSLAQLAGCGVTKVKDSRTWLAAKGWIEWEQQEGQPNIYRVHTSPQQAPGTSPPRGDPPGTSPPRGDPPGTSPPRGDPSPPRGEPSPPGGEVEKPDGKETRARGLRGDKRGDERDAPAPAGEAPEPEPWRPVSNAPEADHVVDYPSDRPDNLKKLWDLAWERQGECGRCLLRYRLPHGLTIDFGYQLDIGDGGISDSRRTLVLFMDPWPEIDLRAWHQRVTYLYNTLFPASQRHPCRWVQRPAADYPRPALSVRWIEEVEAR